MLQQARLNALLRLAEAHTRRPRRSPACSSHLAGEVVSKAFSLLLLQYLTFIFNVATTLSLFARELPLIPPLPPLKMQRKHYVSGALSANPFGYDYRNKRLPTKKRLPSYFTRCCHQPCSPGNVKQPLQYIVHLAGARKKPHQKDRQKDRHRGITHQSHHTHITGHHPTKTRPENS